MSGEQEMFSLRLSGENAASAETIAKALTAINGLVKEVASEMGIEDLTLNVGQMGWICDGCECDRPEDHADWIKRDGLDYCPTCQRTVGARAGAERGGVVSGKRLYRCRSWRVREFGFCYWRGYRLPKNAGLQCPWCGDDVRGVS